MFISLDIARLNEKEKSFAIDWAINIKSEAD